MEMKDEIRIERLSCAGTLAESGWPSLGPGVSSEQPVEVSVVVVGDLTQAGAGDELGASVDYSTLSKQLRGAVSAAENVTAYGLAQRLLTSALASLSPSRLLSLSLTATLPRAVLWATSASVSVSSDSNEAARFAIDGLALHTVVGIHAHERLHRQPVVIALAFRFSPQESDDDTRRRGLETALQAGFKFPFAHIEAHIADFVESSSYQTIEALAYNTVKQAFTALAAPYPSIQPINPHHWTIAVELAKPAAIRLAHAPVIALQRRATDFPDLHLHRDFGLSQAPTAIGVGPANATPEREAGAVEAEVKREELELETSPSPIANPPLESDLVVEEEERSTPKPKRTRPSLLAALALGSNLGDRVQNIEKAFRHLDAPHALAWARSDSDGAADDAATSPAPPAPSEADSGARSREEEEELRVVATSFLYETAPMYVTAQPAFVNCAALVETTLSPTALLRVCKAIEHAVGRVPSTRFGPRAVDLDVVTYAAERIDTRAPGHRDSLELDALEGALVVPHPRMQEREFVLRPLADIIPEWTHPTLGKSVRELLAQVESQKPPDDPPMRKVLAFPVPPTAAPFATTTVPSSTTNERNGVPSLSPDDAPATQAYWTFDASPSPSSSLSSPPPHASQSQPGKAKRTYIMATLNATPDSFSDGALHASPAAALAYARAAVRAGADIIDVGGYSTRPGAAAVSPEDEIRRVVPVIRAIRSFSLSGSDDVDGDDAGEEEEKVRTVLISVDTFRPEVAAAALEAGANCINDVHAFSGPAYPPVERDAGRVRADMVALARRTGVPVIMMHSRGDAGANKDYSAFEVEVAKGRGVSVPPVVRAVQLELGAKLAGVLGPGGLRRWQVVVDPGIGFSKHVADNLALLRCTARLTSYDTVEAEPSSSFNDNTGVCAYATPRLNPLAGFPALVGTSRKSFLGSILAEPLPRDRASLSDDADADAAHAQGKTRAQAQARPAKERDFATAAAVACAVQQGAAVVRVHAVQEMVDVVKVASALWP